MAKYLNSTNNKQTNKHHREKIIEKFIPKIENENLINNSFIPVNAK